MTERIDLLSMAAAMARHAGQRQAVVAQNIANADTPGYKARDIASFADVMRDAGARFQPKATRPAHLFGQAAAPDVVPEADIIRAAAEGGKPNGNAVSLESEMLRAAAVKQEHDKALAIYRFGLSVLRSSLGRR
ncbi:FlgB family protein [Aquicoccus sp. G2-2]|uniref:FlgB family protein n=1 Tax=Aquicoccus sp. G2-2 TaxID=3092120 RepID=UPI002ADF81EF|nr:FlgB family protein [Aquicoccus sp. G2-2]MEA1114407.1 FlgB family protein [Aquicoccus sp. G2-2]